MSKKNKNKSTITVFTTDDSQESSEKEESILDQRIKKRKIPRVDDGVKDAILSNDDLKKFYKQAHVSEFVHMEVKGKTNKKPHTTNRIKFEFSNLILKNFKVNIDENGENDIIRKLSYAELTKKSFINNINNIMRYINYFIEYYDDDDELMLAYFTMMFQMMYSTIDLDPESFVENTYAAFSTDSLIQKVVRMVEYNTDKTMIKTTDRTYDESIQLTLEHLKAIMCVSCLHKFVIPIVSHYCNIKSRLLEEHKITDKDLYYSVFSSFIPLFDDVYDISLYDKLYHTATTRVTKTTNQESPMWKRRYRLGTTPTSFTNKLMQEFLINISQKVIFSKSAIVFIHVCFDKAIKNELMQTDKFEFTDMRMDPSDPVNETISRFDRWQMDKAFHSEKDRIRAYVSIKDILYRLGREFGLDFKRMDSDKTKDKQMTKELREEFEYYRDNIPSPMSDSQMFIIQLYLADKLGNSEDIKMMEISDLIKLIMVMKRDFNRRNFSYLQFFISGKLNPVAGRGFNKRKADNMFSNHPCYEDWLEEFPDSAELLNMDKIHIMIKTIISCPITVVEWEYEEYRGHHIDPTEITVVDEIIRFLLSID